VELPAGHLLAGLDGSANALILETDLLAKVAICQLSGSLTQTAYALLSDLLAIARSAGRS
jgi:homoserine dehydrogenase